MNTADRTVGHLDYAVRRRFYFIQCDSMESDLTNYEHYQDNAPLRELTLFRGVKKLFDGNYLSPDFDARDVTVGHTYFMAKDGEELKGKYLYQVVPLLREYLRDGVLRPQERQILLELGGKPVDLMDNEIHEKASHVLSTLFQPA